MISKDKFNRFFQTASNTLFNPPAEIRDAFSTNFIIKQTTNLKSTQSNRIAYLKDSFGMLTSLSLGLLLLMRATLVVGGACDAVDAKIDAQQRLVCASIVSLCVLILQQPHKQTITIYYIYMGFASRCGSRQRPIRRRGAHRCRIAPLRRHLPRQSSTRGLARPPTLSSWQASIALFLLLLHVLPLADKSLSFDRCLSRFKHW